jgi:signal transduction histidine kinase
MDSLQVRLELLERVRIVELSLARAEHARAAAQLIRGRTHELGNQVQILRLASIELERRAPPEQQELIADLRAAAEAANTALAQMIAAAHPEERRGPGEPAAPILRETIELVRAATSVPLEVHLDLTEDARTRATARELEACVLSALLTSTWGQGAATRLHVRARQRQIEKKPWIEVLVIADRMPFEAPPGVVAAVAEAAGGGASLSDGRTGIELAIELPISQSSSSS